MIIRLVKMTFRPEEVDNFLEVFESTKDYIRGFDGCEHLDLLQDVNQPNIFFTYSYWQSEDDLENYRHSELFKSVWSRTKPLFARKAEAWSTERKSGA